VELAHILDQNGILPEGPQNQCLSGWLSTEKKKKKKKKKNVETGDLPHGGMGKDWGKGKGRWPELQAPCPKI